MFGEGGFQGGKDLPMGMRAGRRGKSNPPIPSTQRPGLVFLGKTGLWLGRGVIDWPSKKKRRGGELLFSFTAGRAVLALCGMEW